MLRQFLDKNLGQLSLKKYDNFFEEFFIIGYNCIRQVDWFAKDMHAYPY